MVCLNKVMLMGYVGNSPMLINRGEAIIAYICIGQDRFYPDKYTGKMMRKTTWHRITFFGDVADKVLDKVSKGDLVYIEGYLSPNSFEDRNHRNHYVNNIVGQIFQVLSKKSKDKGNENEETIEEDSDYQGEDIQAY